jgi:hypothetical protein
MEVENTLLNNHWVIDEVKKFVDSNSNEDKAYQNLWGTATAILQWKLKVMIALIRNLERTQINNLIMYIKFL